MITFEKIKFKNFLSTGNNYTEIQLNKVPTTLIIGTNGSGKSTFLDALTFSLFGKSFRGINKSQLVNSVNEKDCIVEIEFIISSKKYKVIRGIKPNIFEIYVNDTLLDQQSSSVEQQKWLEQNILKMNYKSFTQIVIIGSSNFIPFMQLPSASRREVIEDLLDIKIFSSMDNLAKEKIKQIKLNLSNLNNKKDIIENKVLMQTNLIETINNKNSSSIQERKNKIKNLLNSINDLTEQNSTIREEISNITLELDKISDPTSKLIEFASIKSKLTEKNNSSSKNYHFFKENDNCPTCYQKIDIKFKGSKIDQYESELGKYSLALNEIEKFIEIENSKKEKYLELSKKINKLKNISLDYNSKINSNKIQIKEYSDEISKISELNYNEREEQKKLIEYQTELNEILSSISEMNEELQNYSFCHSLLKDGGVKSTIIKKYIPLINCQINKYLHMMDFFINFIIDEEFNEKIQSPIHDEFSYVSFSEGERSRINLALLFAWREVAKYKNSVNCNLIIFDEVFDSSLDGYGIDDFVKIIKYIIKDANIFVISHKSGMEDKFDNIIKFEKIKNFSRAL